MLDNSILSVGTIHLLKCFNIVNREQLKAHTLKLGDKAGFYSTLSVKQKHLDEINELLSA